MTKAEREAKEKEQQERHEDQKSAADVLIERAKAMEERLTARERERQERETA